MLVHFPPGDSYGMQGTVEEVRGSIMLGIQRRLGIPGSADLSPTHLGAEDCDQQPGQGADQPQWLPLRLRGWGWWPHTDHAGPLKAVEQY